ncbi:conserved hypothetical protein [Neospora caninum Liverpool]|nr:conserved hypothetical protein [Neospora caninum Liverpool]CBZ52691.1 conserved hypothetical protein [Neospora caninum Liverpool]|eukprot:XP_003882723.1 conserved hypothetical protein [Neospora caninum Liverpool]
MEDDEGLKEQAEKALKRKKVMRKHFDDMLEYGRRMYAKRGGKRDEEIARDEDIARDEEEDPRGERRDAHAEDEGEQPVKRGRNRNREDRRERRSREAGAEKGGDPDSHRQGAWPLETLRQDTDEGESETQKSRERGEGESETQKSRERGEGTAEDQQSGEGDTTANSSSPDSAERGARESVGARPGEDEELERLHNENGDSCPGAQPGSSPQSSARSSCARDETSGTWFEAHDAQVDRFMKRTRAAEWEETLKVGEKEVTLVSQAWGRSPCASPRGKRKEKPRPNAATARPEAAEIGDNALPFDDEDDQDLPAIVQSPDRDWLQETWIDGGDAYTPSASQAQLLDSCDFFGSAGGWRSYRRTAAEVDRDMEDMVGAETRQGADFFDAFEQVAEEDEAIEHLLDSRHSRTHRRATGQPREDNVEAFCNLPASSGVDAEKHEVGDGPETESEDSEERERQRVRGGGDSVWEAVAHATETEQPGAGFWET